MPASIAQVKAKALNAVHMNDRKVITGFCNNAVEHAMQKPQWRVPNIALATDKCPVIICTKPARPSEQWLAANN